jgi:hypothetical protein
MAIGLSRRSMLLGRGWRRGVGLAVAAVGHGTPPRRESRRALTAGETENSVQHGKDVKPPVVKIWLASANPTRSETRPRAACSAAIGGRVLDRLHRPEQSSSPGLHHQLRGYGSSGTGLGHGSRRASPDTPHAGAGDQALDAQGILNPGKVRSQAGRHPVSPPQAAAWSKRRCKRQPGEGLHAMVKTLFLALLAAVLIGGGAFAVKAFWIEPRSLVITRADIALPQWPAGTRAL